MGTISIERAYEGRAGDGTALSVSETLTLPETTDRLVVDIHHAAMRLLQVTAWDPDGRLRLQYWGVTDGARAVIGPDSSGSSVGSVPGPISAGEWCVEVSGHAGAEAASWSLTVAWGPDAGAPTLPATGTHDWLSDHSATVPTLDLKRVEGPPGRGRSWYRGDFHAHTVASDGKQTPAEMTEQAQRMGLDFFTISEHNVLTLGWPTTDVLVVPATELTSTRGHFNGIGVWRWLDWRPQADHGGCETAEGVSALLADVRAQRGIPMINHPLLPPWRWEWDHVELAEFDAIELWNDPTYPGNAEYATEATLALWTTLWDDGWTHHAFGGSDTHLLPEESHVEGGPPAPVGDPRTYVLADALTVDAILEALAAGRAYLSRGPTCELRADAGDRRVDPGGHLTAEDVAHSPVRATVHVGGCPEGATVHWVGQHGVREIVPAPAPGTTADVTTERRWEPHGWYWLRAEVRTADGELLAVTNPVRAGSGPRRLRTWGDARRGAV